MDLPALQIIIPLFCTGMHLPVWTVGWSTAIMARLWRLWLAYGQHGWQSIWLARWATGPADAGMGHTSGRTSWKHNAAAVWGHKNCLFMHDELWVLKLPLKHQQWINTPSSSPLVCGTRRVLPTGSLTPASELEVDRGTWGSVRRVSDVFISDKHTTHNNHSQRYIVTTLTRLCVLCTDPAAVHDHTESSPVKSSKSLFHVLLLSSISQHSVWSEMTSHNPLHWSVTSLSRCL